MRGDAGLTDNTYHIGFLPNTNNTIEIVIHEDDIITTPHFHIRWCNKRNVNWECAVAFNKCEYLNHSNINFKRIPNRCITAFNKFISSRCYTDSNCRTIWQILIDTWNRYNSTEKVLVNLPQPNYTKLRGRKK